MTPGGLAFKAVVGLDLDFIVLSTSRIEGMQVLDLLMKRGCFRRSWLDLCRECSLYAPCTTLMWHVIPNRHSSQEVHFFFLKLLVVRMEQVAAELKLSEMTRGDTRD